MTTTFARKNSRDIERRMSISQLLGFLGTGIVAAAYIPQIHHLVKEHCSAGISINAYALWCVASIFFLIHGAMIRDMAFVFVQVVNLIAILAILICVKKYGRQMCLMHLREAQTRQR
jgi:uncharacterized protein with PQ loop repeat